MAMTNCIASGSEDNSYEYLLHHLNIIFYFILTTTLCKYHASMACFQFHSESVVLHIACLMIWRILVLGMSVVTLKEWSRLSILLFMIIDFLQIV